ncbi:MAG TPA: peptidase S8, partial [Actinomycetota bacterium]
MRRTSGTSIATLLALALLAPAAHAAPNDPFYDRQWGLQKIDAAGAWSVSDGTGATIAIVDSGVDLDHPD